MLAEFRRPFELGSLDVLRAEAESGLFDLAALDAFRKQEAKSGLFDLATLDDTRKQDASENGMKGGIIRREAAEASWKQPASQAYAECLQNPNKGRPSPDAWARANAKQFEVKPGTHVKPDTLAKHLRKHLREKP